MEQYINKSCKVLVNIGGVMLRYIARITAADHTHIHFTDSKGNEYAFLRTDIKEIQVIKGG